jgi:predicted PurR-regulated permease PerM
MSDQSADPSSAHSPAQVAPANVPGVSGLLSLAVGVVVVAALYLAREVLIPITLAVLLSFVLTPVVNLLRHAHLPRVPAVLLAVVVALGIIVALGSAIGLQVASLASDVPRYATTIEQKVSTVQTDVVGRLSGMMARLDRQAHSAATTPAGAPAATAADGTEQKPIPVEVHEPNPNPLRIAQRVLAPVLSPLETTLIVLVVAIFVLLQKEDLRDRLIRLFGSGDLHRTTVAMDDAAHRLSRYFLSQLAINTTFGLVIGTGLFFIGVPSPILWGIVSGLLRFVPYVGSFIAAVLPTTLAAGVSPGWGMALETAGLYLVVETITGQFVEPMVYGHSTGLSPAAVVIAAIFWTWLWGPIGLILSTPLTLCLVVLGRHVDRLEFLDVILGDRPALTPVENFYQRLLAGDTDEAQDQAELLLKERSLSSYYDEVVLKGLQLAANDCARGVLGDQQLQRVRRSVQHLVTDLATHADADPHPTDAAAAHASASIAEKALPKVPPPGSMTLTEDQLAPAWRTGAPVLCIAGRGPLDEAASTMLAQLLEKHGLGARVVSYDAVSRERIGSLDVEGAAMACLSYLDIAGNPPHLRYLLRRLRRTLPQGTPILVGLWPAEDAVLKDDQMRAQIGADTYVASLHEAVEACVKAACEAAKAAGVRQADAEAAADAESAPAPAPRPVVVAGLPNGALRPA